MMEKNYEANNNIAKNNENIHNRPKLVILVGISGSGKSTFCKYYDTSMIRVNRDSLRTMFSSKSITSYYDQDTNLVKAYENIVNGCEERLLNYFARKRKSVIIDNCNLRKEYIEKYKEKMNRALESSDFSHYSPSRIKTTLDAISQL